MPLSLSPAGPGSRPDRRAFVAGLAALFGAAVAPRTSAHPRPRWLAGPARRLALALTDGRALVGGRLVATTVGVTAEGRLALGVAPGDADVVVSVRDRVVAPGFVDLLADNAASPETTWLTYERYKLTDGVATACQMHGGAGNVARFRATFDARPHWVNYGVSVKVMDVRNAVQAPARRLARIEASLAAGALGVSHSPEYQRDTTEAELLAFARLAARWGRPFVLHTRFSSAERELEGVDEAIRVARAAGARLHVAHLHSTGGTYAMPAALARLRAARAAGLDVTCCVYPYSYWATYIKSQRFDPGWRERYGLDYHDLTVVGTGERLTRASFDRHRADPRTNLLLAVPEGTLPLERTVDLALREPFCLIASDGGIIGARRANSHPRGAGCFATALRHGQRLGLPLPTLLEKMTAGPARLMGLRERGELRDGWWADVTVFDPATVDGRATVADPNQDSRGIDLVLVNGRVAWQDGRLLARAGVGVWAGQ